MYPYKYLSDKRGDENRKNVTWTYTFVVQGVMGKGNPICLGFCCNKKGVENLFILKQVS